MTSHAGRPPANAANHIGGTMPPPVAAVLIDPGSQRVLARVRGEIDMDDADGLRKNLTTALVSSRDGLDVDLSAVTFCDSSGLHVLLDLNRLALEAGKSLVLTALSRPVARLLRLTGTQHTLTVRDWPAEEAPLTGGAPASPRPEAEAEP
ncbi:STAS domain-containing protein [Streptomyces sp. NPDC056773]|uniref:STAS domain-containing protein n=1 Tax=unclassified Streptomyces TaxID=2593676 RepID=UPI0036B9F7C7